MKLHLDRWLKFARRHSDNQADHTPELQHRQQQQQQGQAVSATQMGGGMPAARVDRGGMPDPLRMIGAMMRDPFGSLTQLDQWFGDFSPAAFDPRIDVVDAGDAIRITAEMPGVDAKDVEITLEDEYLVLSGEKRLERQNEERGAYRVERAFGSFQRVIPLPDGVDVKRAEATFDNGTLTIRLPKIAGERSAGRKLEIGSSSTSSPGSSSSSSSSASSQSPSSSASGKTPGSSQLG